MRIPFSVSGRGVGIRTPFITRKVGGGGSAGLTLIESGLLFSDDFDRAEIGPDWDTVGTGWDIGGGELFVAASSTRSAIADSVASGEMLIQAIVRVPNFGSSEGGIHARWERPGADSTQNGYELSLWATSGAPRLFNWVNGSRNVLQAGTSGHENNFPHPMQLYVADGIQQGWTDRGTVSDVNTTHDGANARHGGFRHARWSGTPTTFYKDYLHLRSKNLIVTGVPAGGSARILNGSSEVVASASESGGTATIDASRFGGATEIVPLAGWAKIEVLDDLGDPVAEATEEVYPGSTFAVP